MDLQLTGARAVVLSESAAQILSLQLMRHRSDWVFPNRDGSPYSRVHISRIFRKAVRVAGLTTFIFMIYDTTEPPWP